MWFRQQLDAFGKGGDVKTTRTTMGTFLRLCLCGCDVVDGSVIQICEEITMQKMLFLQKQMSKHTDRTYQWSSGDPAYHIHENTGRKAVITQNMRSQTYVQSGL